VKQNHNEISPPLSLATIKRISEGKGYSLVVENLPTMLQALGLIPRTTKKEITSIGEGMEKRKLWYIVGGNVN
jgi:hypothetical protein